MAEIAFGISESVLEKLGSIAYNEISLTLNTTKDLKKLEEKTILLQSVLEDAEAKQDRNERLRTWLVRLNDILNDAVDVLDKFECEALRRKVVKEYGSIRRKVRRFFSRSNPLAFRFSIAHKVKEIRERLDEIVQDMSQFQMISSQLSNSHQGPRFVTDQESRDRMPTHSYVRPSEVIGRDGDKARIIDMLMSQDHNDLDINSDNSVCSVISIVGLGGLGKTTLAKLVYNDESVVERFSLRMWVFVPLNFSFSEMIREILKSAINAINCAGDENLSLDQSLQSTKSISDLSVDQMQTLLRSVLKDKVFLLVLDDVWKVDYSEWVELREILAVGSRESKILVTTRNNSVASTMGTTSLYNLQRLSEEDALSLFLKYAFGDVKLANQHPKLKIIGSEIVKRCGGVPLAAKTLGSLLSSNTDEGKWMYVRDHEIWEMKKDGDHDPILSALRLSYREMPRHLKQCFVFCSCFSKNVSRHSLQLIFIWMALGILQPDDKIELEDIGKSYFEELCKRSFFQSLDDAEENFSITRGFEMHDLIHDLALSIIPHQNFTISSDTKTVPESVRYLTMSLNDGYDQSILRSLQILKKVRSLRFETNGHPNINEYFISKCISGMTNLRVLDLSGLYLEVLPSSVGTLKHLRCLDLSGNKRIKRLPESVCELQNLQTLGLEGCDELKELPRHIRNLISLRCLTVTLKQSHFLENGIGWLQSLRILYIDNCTNLESLPHNMRYFAALRTLIIVDCEKLDLARGLDTVVPLRLQTLAIGNLPQTTALPQWLQGAAQSLKILVITDCTELVALPEWLPNLTSLERLGIRRCPKLASLPEGMQRLASLTQLRITECGALEERCKREIGEDWPKISHVHIVDIGDD